MNNLEARRERYLKDSLQIRLGGLAANLARISSFVKNPNNLSVVKDLIEESKFFIEWTAKETELETTLELIDLQVKLALIQRNIEFEWKTEDSRLQLGETAKNWSKQVLMNASFI